MANTFEYTVNGIKLSDYVYVDKSVFWRPNYTVRRNTIQPNGFNGAINPLPNPVWDEPQLTFKFAFMENAPQSESKDLTVQQVDTLLQNIFRGSNIQVDRTRGDTTDRATGDIVSPLTIQSVEGCAGATWTTVIAFPKPFFHDINAKTVTLKIPSENSLFDMYTTDNFVSAHPVHVYGSPNDGSWFLDEQYVDTNTDPQNITVHNVIYSSLWTGVTLTDASMTNGTVQLGNNTGRLTGLIIPLSDHHSDAPELNWFAVFGSGTVQVTILKYANSSPDDKTTIVDAHELNFGSGTASLRWFSLPTGIEEANHSIEVRIANTSSSDATVQQPCIAFTQSGTSQYDKCNDIKFFDSNSPNGMFISE